MAACPDEAGQLLSFLMDAAGTSPEHPEGVHIMYGIGGEHDLAERELSSHIGLINAAAAIARAETEASTSPRCVPPES